MTDAISATSSWARAAATTQPPTTQVNRNAMDKDLFLKLLVAQLKYQDPSSPMDQTQMLAQTAQFTQVEKLEEIAKATAEQAALSRLGASVGLVGKTVTYLNGEGTESTGPVTAVRFTEDGTLVRVNGKEIPAASVREVRSS